MNQPFTFRPGQPQHFIATRTFDLGTSGHKAVAGYPLSFDGTQVIIEGAPPITLPNLKGAIRLGWVVPMDQFDPEAVPQRPVSAGVQIRPAEGGNPMEPKPKTTITTNQVEAEEREVSNVQQHAASTAQRNTGNYRRPDGSTVRVEDQEGVVVRRTMTPAKWATDLENTSVDAAIRQAEGVKVQAGVGRSRDEMMAQMTPEARAQYASELAAKAAIHDPAAASRIVASVSAPGTQEREGMRVVGSVGRGTEIADMGGTGTAGIAQMTTTTSEGVVLKNTNGPGTVKRTAQSPVGSGSEGQARQIARAICPDFPDTYVFGDPVRKKIARLQADFDNRPDVIRAVAAADTDPEVRGRLIAEFPEAFG